MHSTVACVDKILMSLPIEVIKKIVYYFPSQISSLFMYILEQLPMLLMLRHTCRAYNNSLRLEPYKLALYAICVVNHCTLVNNADWQVLLMATVLGYTQIEKSDYNITTI